MKLPADTMRHRAVLLTASESGDQYGQPTRAWQQDGAPKWISIEPMRLRDIFAAGQAQATETHVVRMAWSPTPPTTQQRLQLVTSGRLFSITRVSDVDESHRVTELLVTERVDGTDDG
jgi:SPP1 family predicted phage head-tail adaptor